jgi:hypothetical protein
MRHFLRNNGLSVVVTALFVLSLVGHAVAGRLQYNEDQQSHGSPAVGMVDYITTGHFAESVFENWESEFLQMGLYVFLTAFLVQRGSAESKKPKDEQDGTEGMDEDPAKHRNDPDAPGPVRRGGWLLRVYQNSLSIAFLLLFLVSFVGHVLGGTVEYNQEQMEHGEPTVTTLGYLATPTLWFESFQNWQSEFLSVIGIVVLSIWLRQKGSPESKPVHAPHSKTGAS